MIAWLAMGVALADPAARVTRQLERERFEAARDTCLDRRADDTSADRALREVCAAAWRPIAEDLDRPARWRYYARTWQGTAAAATAGESEATSALGLATGLAGWQAVVDTYPATAAATAATERLAAAALGSLDSPGDALAFVTAWPEHPAVPQVVLDHAAAFFTVDEALDVTWVGPWRGDVSLAWAARLPNDDRQWSFDVAAAVVLADEGIAGVSPSACGLPDPWIVAPSARIGAAERMLDGPAPPPCVGRPIEIEVAAGRVVRLGDRALPTAGPWIPWSGATALAPEALPAPLMAEDMLWYPAGDHAFVLPLDGSLPAWVDGPPKGAPLGLTVRDGARTLPPLAVESLGLFAVKRELPAVEGAGNALPTTDRRLVSAALAKHGLDVSVSRAWALPAEAGWLAAGKRAGTPVVVILLPGSRLTVIDGAAPSGPAVVADGAALAVRWKDRELHLSGDRAWLR